MWIDIKSKEDLPKEGGTKAVVYMGITAWMYWNADKHTWHPISGWRRIAGYPWNDVTAYMELPTYLASFNGKDTDLISQ